MTKFAAYLLTTMVAFSAVCQAQEVLEQPTKNLRQTQPSDETMDRPKRRELFSFISLLFMAASEHHPHPPHPHPDSSGGDNGSSGSSSGTSAVSSSSDGGGGGGIWNWWGGGGGGASAASTSNGGGGGGGGSAGASSGSGSGASSSKMTSMNTQQLSALMGSIAAAAALTAFIAMFIGQRKKIAPKHPLTGAVNHRKNLFSSFLSTHVPNEVVDRPDRMVEMSEGEYKLQGTPA